jgi:major membrane immunogen (membrane-anchored lipoprotein)
MKTKLLFIFLATLLLLTACGLKKMDGTLKLVDQNNKEITFPQDKPAVFFFITTYT